MQVKTYKRPESILIVVYTRTMKVLMLRRLPPNPFWQSVTGSLRWNEDKESAAKRELFEETGIVAGELQDCNQSHEFEIFPEALYLYAPGVELNKEHVFRLELAEVCDVKLNPDEHSEFCWLSIADAAELTASWTNREAILTLNLKVTRSKPGL